MLNKLTLSLIADVKFSYCMTTDLLVINKSIPAFVIQRFEKKLCGKGPSIKVVGTKSRNIDPLP